jgi:hypothetical protein
MQQATTQYYQHQLFTATLYKHLDLTAYEHNNSEISCTTFLLTLTSIMEYYKTIFLFNYFLDVEGGLI